MSSRATSNFTREHKRRTKATCYKCQDLEYYACKCPSEALSMKMFMFQRSSYVDDALESFEVPLHVMMCILPTLRGEEDWTTAIFRIYIKNSGKPCKLINLWRLLHKCGL